MLTAIFLTYLFLALQMTVYLAWGERRELIPYGTCFNGCDPLMLFLVGAMWPALLVMAVVERVREFRRERRR